MQIQSNSQTTMAPIQSNDQSVEAKQPKLSIYQQTQSMQNLAILNANNSSTANHPMALLYKTAIEEINKQLEPTFGKNSVQAAYESKLDISPQATAQRIIQGSTAFYDAFKKQNSELSEEESLTEFINVISTGIDKGFAEAKEILDSLSVLEGEIATNIELTYDFVQQGLLDFQARFLAELADKEAGVE